MKTDVVTPMQIFGLPQHFVVPLFQRPYVWEEDEQWQPLWADIRRMADLRIAEPYKNAYHFLGALVVQAMEGNVHVLQARNVIDGQQRLTTLQLVMDATSAVLDELGEERLSAQLEDLTHNSANHVPEGQIRLKLRHTNKDQGPFDEVMQAEVPIGYETLGHHDSRIARAHRYFDGVVRTWLGDAEAAEFTTRANALVWVLTQGLQLVAIDLSAQENSQEIFETLNARGTPLTAADLIRNFVFQKLAAEGADTEAAHKKDWPFETKFWEEELAVGKQKVGRSSLFLNQWLVARTGEEVSPSSTFTRFKHYVEHESGQKMADLLPVIKKQADTYESWVQASNDETRQLDAVQMCVYRMQAIGTQVLMPILIWLHSPSRQLSDESIKRVVAAIESWLLRRVLLRLTLSDMGRTVEAIIQSHSKASDDDLADRVVAHLSRLNVTSNYWPADKEVLETLEGLNAFTTYVRARLRMMLIAIEDSFRAESGQPQVVRKVYPVEHLLPQTWHENWPVEDEEAEVERQAHVHRLGNLTLLTTKLNSSVSNSPWAKKRIALLKHNTINMTGRLVADDEAKGWDEETIDARTTELAKALLKLWPVPEGHKGEVVDVKPVATADWATVKDLLDAGLLSAGELLHSRGEWAATAEVMADGQLKVDGKLFDTPSGAGKYPRGGKATNGWRFWKLDDGRWLGDVRAEFEAIRGTSLGVAAAWVKPELNLPDQVLDELAGRDLDVE